MFEGRESPEIRVSGKNLEALDGYHSNATEIRRIRRVVQVVDTGKGCKGDRERKVAGKPHSANLSVNHNEFLNPLIYIAAVRTRSCT